MNTVKRNTITFPSLLDEFFKPDWMGGIQGIRSSIPAVNIKETDVNFIVELAAPGLNKSDFSIEIENKSLSVSCELKANQEQVNERYTRREFSYTSFKRTFSLPEIINEDTIEANYENGVLLITLPKKIEAVTKTKKMIEIL